jgi:CRP-like cAMP-binding protein
MYGTPEPGRPECMVEQSERSVFMTEKLFQKGDVIFNQGDQGTTLYQIIDGSVEIVVRDVEGGDLPIAELKKNQFFGEMAVIDARPRSASAVALEDGTKVMEISADELNAYFERDPQYTTMLMKTLSKRLRERTDDYEEAKAVMEALGECEKSQDEELARSVKKCNAFFKYHKDTPSAELVREEKKKDHSEGYAKNVATYHKGTIICREGDVVQCMYDIHYGRVGVFVNYGRSDQIQLTTLGANDFFGEMGMVEGAARSATAVALDDNTTVEVIYPEDFADLYKQNPPKFFMILSHLSNRLRVLTTQYYDLCEKIAKRTGATA